MKMVLLWGTLKKEQHWWNKYFYTHFDLLVMATIKDQKKLQLPSKSLVYDFRIIQILDRIKVQEVKLKKVFSYQNLDTKDRILFGNFWLEEFEYFLTAYNSHHFTRVDIAPHKTNQHYIKKIEEKLKQQGIAYKIIDGTQQRPWSDEPLVYLYTMRGYLLELYHLYSHAYVGGGTRTSVHSLLEPYLNHTLLSCGPRVHRSTEYDLVVQNQEQAVTLIHHHEDFKNWLLKISKKELPSIDLDKLYQQKQQFDDIAKQVLE